STTTCSFTATTSGAFTVTVKAVNEVDTAATGGTGNGTIVFTPTGTVSGLDSSTSLGSATVSVSWSQLLSGWQGGTTKQYAVTVTPPTGATLSDDECTTAPVSDSATPQCTFDV